MSVQDFRDASGEGWIWFWSHSLTACKIWLTWLLSWGSVGSPGITVSCLSELEGSPGEAPCNQIVVMWLRWVRMGWEERGMGISDLDLGYHYIWWMEGLILDPSLSSFRPPPPPDWSPLSSSDLISLSFLKRDFSFLSGSNGRIEEWGWIWKEC